MGTHGFTAHIPDHWKPWWVIYWLVASPALIVSAFFLDFAVWVALAVLGFLVPELISLIRQDDGYPPLTHTLRHFVPNWVAFPLIYFSLGAVGAHWLEFDEPIRIGLLMGLLGWLTDHFTVTYAGSDPFPYSNRAQRQTDGPNMPA